MFIHKYISDIIFPRVRIDTWDENIWPLKFLNGVSYIYDRSEADTVIVFSHGSGGNLTGRSRIRELVKEWSDKSSNKLGFLMYDYYGYGASDDTSTISETSFTKSIETVFDLVREKKVILIGASLGSYPSCWLASQNHKNIVGIVLCVPFDSFDTISPLAYYIIGSYDNYSLAKSIKSQTLIIKSEYDEIVPYHSAERLGSAIVNCEVISVMENHKSYLNDVAKAHILEFINKIIN